jgi:3-oxoacyl-[acyl-carrier protein] reductase
MDLDLKNKTIAVGGATSGLGLAVTEALLKEGATVIGLARTQHKLDKLVAEYPDRFIPHRVDLTIPSSVNQLVKTLNEAKVYGVCFNAGGPPPKMTMETDLDDWDSAYKSTLRWKVQLLQGILPDMLKRKEGRMVFIESVSIKQPIDGLVLSNSFRAAVAGLVSTVSRENGGQGVTYNIMAPGYHATPRITAVLKQSAELQNISVEEAEAQFAAEVPTGKIGDPQDFGSLAAWLFSPQSRYVTGQTITVDGGMVRHLMG